MTIGRLRHIHMRYFLTVGLSALLMMSCVSDQKQSLHRASRLLMGTLVEITVVGEGEKAKTAAEAIFSEIKRVEALTSFHSPSELMRVNDNAGKGPVKTDPELLELIAESLRIAQKTHGAFDPTVGPLSRLWQFSGSNEPRIPEESEIREALTKVGWIRIKIDSAAGTILLPEPGMALDLGGIAKGYALNHVARIIEKLGVSGALVNIGGDILALGEKEPGKPWRVGVEDPRNPRGIVAVTLLKDRVIVTSGDYERYFIKDGKRYHHILDPVTGYPADKLQSATIVGPVGVTLQPLGTAAFVMGVERGLKLVESVTGAKGLLIDSEGNLSSYRRSRDYF